MKLLKNILLILLVNSIVAIDIKCQENFLGYLSIDEINPGQLRYAQKNVELKVNNALTKGNVKQQDGTFSDYKFDDGKSIIAQKDALPVIKGPGEIGYILVDGHHDLLSSRAVGAKTVPIKLLADFSNLSPSEFWQEAQKSNFIYPYNLAGKKIIPLPRDWNNLEDDPNRYFAAIAARKCAKKDTPPNESTGAEYPLWVKVGKDIPFIEFMISDNLMKANIFYSNDMGEDMLSSKLEPLVEKSRKALQKNPIKGLKLVPTKIEYTKINNGNICGYTGE